MNNSLAYKEDIWEELINGQTVAGSGVCYGRIGGMWTGDGRGRGSTGNAGRDRGRGV